MNTMMIIVSGLRECSGRASVQGCRILGSRLKAAEFGFLVLTATGGRVWEVRPKGRV